jgi:PEP-CTERM/exosortase A-associated glycosyltransferase
MPFLCGYSIRSDYLIRFQQEHGIEPAVVTSAQQPPSSDVFTHEREIPHWRTPALGHSLPPLVREIALMRALEKQLLKEATHWKPDLIHAHSPMLVGLPALRVARRLKIPLVYEVRDLWENASVDRGKFRDGSPAYKLARAMETRVLQQASATVTICQSLARELAPRVRTKDGLFVVGNGVDATKFTPIESAEWFRKNWNLCGKKVLAYIGTFQPYEGLDTLIAALPEILKSVPAAHVMIVGSGGVESELKAQTERLGLGGSVTFTGRLAHNEVGSAYSIADAMVYPRVLTRTTALTTPLKPLEAMAMGKAVIASDVPAMQELVQDGTTGVTFRAGDVADLAQKCIHLLQSSSERRHLETSGRDWVVSERDWPHLVAQYKNIYEFASGESQ